MADPSKARVFAAIAATPAMTRPEARRRLALRLAASGVLALAVFEAGGGLEHAAGRPLGYTLAIAGGWGLGSAGLSWLVLARGRSTLRRAPGRVLLAALAAPFAFFAWMVAFTGQYTEPFARVGWRCAAYTLAMAAAPLGALLAFRRGAEPRAPGSLGAGLGVVCAAWAGVVVDLWCPLTNAPHVLVGHVLPVVLALGAGALLGRRVLGVGASGPR